MFIRTLSSTLLQIFCEFMLHPKVIFESMREADDTFYVYLQTLILPAVLIWPPQHPPDLH